MLRFVLLLSALALPAARAAESADSFTKGLSQQQKQRLGLANLTAEQLASLDAAVEMYKQGAAPALRPAGPVVGRRGEEGVPPLFREGQPGDQRAVPPPPKGAAVAPEASITDDGKKRAPGAGVPALAGSRSDREDTGRERFFGRIVGPFHGWSGGTYFPLDNGQVWRQTGTEVNEIPTVQSAEVEIYKSGNGYWRLRHNGAWITVKRLQ